MSPKSSTFKSRDKERHITLSSSRSLRIVRQKDIIYLQSDNCYTNIYLIDKSCYLMCKTLKNYEAELNKDLFFRCHKSFLVNRYFIKEIIKQCGEYLLLTTGVKIPISRRKSLILRRLLFSLAVN